MRTPAAAPLLFDDRPSPEQIVSDALRAEGPVIRTYCLFSGGGDSIVVAHRCRELYDELAHIDTGTALPGVRDHVEATARALGKPLRILEAGREAYRDLVIGDPIWRARYGQARELEPELSVEAFVEREADTRRAGDGLGNSPQGFPGPGSGGHRAAYARLKERQVERLVRDTKAELAAGRRERVALLSGARVPESKRRRRTQAGGTYRRRKAQLWVNAVHLWTDDEMRDYRREHGIRVSDVAALLHRSGECNCGAYISEAERKDVITFYPDWYAEVIAPLELAAAELGVPRCRWGDRSVTDVRERDASPMCSSCQLQLET